MKASAQELHTITALETIREHNRSAAAHNELLQARREEANLRLAAAKEEQRRQQEIIAEIDHDGRNLGRQYHRQRTKLARSAMSVVRDSSGVITDRSMLWDIVSEHELAHFEDATVKQNYSTLLQAIDTNLREAYEDKSTLPILSLERDIERGESLREVSIRYSDPTSNGLSFDTTREWYLTPQVKTIAGDDTKLIVGTPDYARWLLDEYEIQAASLDDNGERRRSKWRKDHIMGKVAIRHYVQLFVDGDPHHDEELLQIGKALCRSSPELVTAIKNTAPDVAAIWSATALEQLQNSHTSSILPNAYGYGGNYSTLALLDKHDREVYRDKFAQQLKLDRSFTDPYLDLLYKSADSIGN